MTNIAAPDNLFNVDDDRKAKNERRALERGLEPCEHCGRGVLPGKGYLIIVVAGGSQIAEPGSAEATDYKDSGYMGGYVFGSTCARSVPATHRVIWNG